MGACQTAAEAQKNEWLQQSWAGGKADPLMLCELRTRADAYRGLIETTYERFCELNRSNPRSE